MIGNRKIIAIDPGTVNCGWCCIREDGPILEDYGVIRARERVVLLNRVSGSGRAGKVKEDYLTRIDAIIAELLPLTEDADLVLIEMPSHYSAGKGEAARNSGAILKLVFLVATIRAYVGAHRCVLVDVRAWKGTIPKQITQNRMERFWNRKFDDVRHDVVDAIGLGTWWLRQQP